jgi:hypothetical protein
MSEWTVGTRLAVWLAAFLLGWYVIGLFVNRRRAGQLLRQLRDSLQPLGGETAIGLLGRSAFRVEARQVRAPLSAVGIDLRLEPRETFLVWIVARWLGRRDWLVLNASLDGAAKGAFEVYHPRCRGAAESVREIRSLNWHTAPVPGRPELLCAAPGADGRALAQEALSLLGGLDVWRIRLRDGAPQLSISLPILPSETRVPLPIVHALPDLARMVLSAQASDGSG